MGINNSVTNDNKNNSREMQDSDDEAQGQAISGKHPKKPIWKIVKSCIFLIICLILSLILVNILLVKESGRTPELFGFRLYRIETGSMDPTLPVGSIIFSGSPGDASGLKKDQIITFVRPDGKTITHRIIEVVMNDDGTVKYRTKGDNPINSPDEDAVTQDMIEAVFILKLPLT